jgi:hypothetical protein
LTDGEERYLEECPEGVDPAVSAAAVAAIKAHPDVRPTLTEWAGFTGGLDAFFVGQIAAAERAIALIDAELREGSAAPRDTGRAGPVSTGSPSAQPGRRPPRP